jgi:hypothetical protein
VATDASPCPSLPSGSNPQHKVEEKPGHATLNSPLSTPRRLTLPTSPVAPYSASKQELKEAAIALTWLAEAMTCKGHNSAAAASPIAAIRHDSKNYHQRLAGKESDRSGTGLVRGRRAASRRCSTVIQEAIMAERELGKELALSPKNYATVASDRQARRVSRPNNSLSLESTVFQKQKQTKGYSMNSRVGRAMLAILEYIEAHQSEYVGTGVPERILRQEFGNNPDTSKALRFLVSERKIIRAGLGGRRDPFSYTMAEEEQATAGEDKEIDKDKNNEGVDPCAGTPAGETFVVETCAAAAALAAPSTGKWLSPDPVLRRETARHRVQQPRLSLSMGGSRMLTGDDEKGRSPVANEADNDTMTDASLQARKRSAPLQTPPSSQLDLEDMVSKKQALTGPVSVQANVRPGNLKVNPKNIQEQFLATSRGPWGCWPTQLPISQRLSATTTNRQNVAMEHSSKNGSSVLMEQAGGPEVVTGPISQQATQQATQAFFLQLRAAQLFWQHRKQNEGDEISMTPATKNASSIPQ